MKAAGEAVVHAVVVGPVLFLARVIDTSAKVCRAVAAFVGYFVGEQPPPQSGVGELETA